jgi:16S rRNA (guanine527-N7)-methyltransferase
MDLLKESFEKIGISATNDQIEQLTQYAALIQKWNKVYNLTAIRKFDEILTHHIFDSLSVLPTIDSLLQDIPNPSLLDVGAGAGLPGIVFAIMRPQWQINLVDAVQKKAAFMQQAIGNLKLTNAVALHLRVEDLKGQSFDTICSRAFSSLENFIGLSHHLLAENGCFVAMKGRAEVDSRIPEGWFIQSLVPIEVPFLQEERHLFLIKR